MGAPALYVYCFVEGTECEAGFYAGCFEYEAQPFG